MALQINALEQVISDGTHSYEVSNIGIYPNIIPRLVSLVPSHAIAEEASLSSNKLVIGLFIITETREFDLRAEDYTEVDPR